MEAAAIDPILSIRNLRIAFPGGAKPAVAVQDLSLDLYPGQVTALIGESGSGKSATILAILGLLPADTLVSGEIDLGQGSLSFADEKSLEALRGRVVGTVFQDPLATNPVLTIGEQIDEVFQAHRGLLASGARAKRRAGTCRPAPPPAP
jgi:ABC-type glutathione transport system ATPase component